MEMKVMPHSYILCSAYRPSPKVPVTKYSLKSSSSSPTFNLAIAHVIHSDLLLGTSAQSYPRYRLPFSRITKYVQGNQRGFNVMLLFLSNWVEAEWFLGTHAQSTQRGREK